VLSSFVRPHRQKRHFCPGQTLWDIQFPVLQNMLVEAHKILRICWVAYPLERNTVHWYIENLKSTNQMMSEYCECRNRHTSTHRDHGKNHTRMSSIFRRRGESFASPCSGASNVSVPIMCVMGQAERSSSRDRYR